MNFMNKKGVLLFIMSISANIRMFRKKAGITQIDLANKLGVSIATLRRWEGGETTPTGSRINELAACLDIAPEDIVSANPEEKLKNILPASNGMLVFEQGGSRIELPPTERGYEILNKLVENMIKNNKDN